MTMGPGEGSHKYTKENTLVYNGSRNCKECRKAYKRSYDAKKKAERCQQ